MSPGFRQLGQGWRLLLCDCRARAERAYGQMNAYVPPLRRSAPHPYPQIDKLDTRFFCCSFAAVLDAVQIAGRSVNSAVLERLSQRAMAEPPPLRSTLIEDFCRATHWRNRRGELAVSSAGVFLKRLEALGMVRLPASSRSVSPPRPRQLRDDGQPLPVLPKLPASVEQLQNLRLQLLSGQNDPDHLLWNRLIIREHPLAGAPLVGSQLRYLLRSDEGILGAFGFGPASQHLNCRDGWIGWDYSTRRANLHRVIGLSRFLIRPGLHCRNLASRAYKLVLDRVAQDWQEHYHLTPVLVETFVDRRHHSGVSLLAANWLRLGQSSGRGRSNPSKKERPQSPKDVWICPLHPQARQTLQSRAVTLVTPRSIFQRSQTPWTHVELDGLDLGNRRLERRFAQLLEARAKHPSLSFRASFQDPAMTKAAYRFLVNPQAGIGFETLLRPHWEQTRRRMAAESVVVLAQDTTTLSYNSLAATEGLGPVGEQRNPGRGLFLHSLMAFRLDGIPLGCVWAKWWAREESPTERVHRDEQSIDQKESVRWLEGYQEASRAARGMPQTQLIVCQDRESDIFEFFDQAQAAPKNLHFLVRAQHDRELQSGKRLWAELTAQPVGGTMVLRVPRRGEQPARTATLELRWLAVALPQPKVKLKKGWPVIQLWAVMAREIHAPAGVEPIEWVLLTDWKVDSLKMAKRGINWYWLRWGIECWHQVIKGVNGIETRQMKSATALARALVLDMITGWRALLLARLGKQQPQLPAELYYSPEELEVLEDHKKKLPRWTLEGVARPEPLEPPPSALPPPAGKAATAQRIESSESPKALEVAVSIPKRTQDPKQSVMPVPKINRVTRTALTLLQANILVSMLGGGFQGRRGDGHPGPKVMQRGLLVLAAIVLDRRVRKETPSKPPTPLRRARKPG